ncbi:hypothetical protein WJX82_006923 [Trebouxia sp. C0006]
MFGRDGLGTGFHVDRSQAEKVAFPMVCLRKGKKATDKPKHKLQPLVLAVWWFVHPYVAAEFGTLPAHCSEGMRRHKTTWPLHQY